MSGEWFYYGIWGAQAVLALVILLRDAYHRDWPRIAGIFAGLVVGLLPFTNAFIPFVPRTSFLFVYFLVPIALTVAYGLRRRWLPFVVALACCGNPTVYLLVARQISSERAAAAAPEPLGVLFEANFFLAPILAVLAGREFGAWLGSRAAKEAVA